MRKYFNASLVALALFLIVLTYTTCIHRTKGFCYKKIHSLYSYDPRWDFGVPNPEQNALLEKISTQTFSLLGSGKECYAFVSDDGLFVVKFFKQKHMKTQYLIDYLPLSQQLQMIRREVLNRHKSHRNRLYQSYQLAYERLFDHSGVLYLHLTKTNYIKKAITIRSPSGKRLALKLDDMEFLVQKRAYSIFDTIANAPKKGEETIDAILDYLASRNARGIGDDDINCARNLGILEGKVMQVDIGELYPALPRPAPEKELIAATLDLKDFLERKHPHLARYLDAEIERRCR
ncbi:MAG: hypothetical protein KDK64_07865 [Chlamydiia bacterium]|nr:hypothetical protein [Chlamydiia bacterium]